MRQHPVDGRVACGIVAEPARPVSLEPFDVAAKLERIAVAHGFLDRDGHAAGLDLCDPFEDGDAPIGRDAGRRTADCNRAGALGMAGGEMQGDRAADGNARQRDLSRNRVVIQQRGDIVGHRVERKLAAHLLRQARAAAIVAQDLLVAANGGATSSQLSSEPPISCTSTSVFAPLPLSSWRRPAPLISAKSMRRSLRFLNTLVKSQRDVFYWRP